MFFSNDLQPYQCTIELEQSGKTQRQVITAPRIVITQQIMEIGKTICNAPVPCRCKVSRIVPIYDKFENKWVDREFSIEFKNRAYENQYGK